MAGNKNTKILILSFFVFLAICLAIFFHMWSQTTPRWEKGSDYFKKLEVSKPATYKKKIEVRRDSSAKKRE